MTNGSKKTKTKTKSAALGEFTAKANELKKALLHDFGAVSFITNPIHKICIALSLRPSLLLSTNLFKPSRPKRTIHESCDTDRTREFAVGLQIIPK